MNEKITLKNFAILFFASLITFVSCDKTKSEYYWAKEFSVPLESGIAKDVNKGLSVFQTDEGDYIFAGDITFNNQAQYARFSDIWVSRISAKGEVLWAKAYGGGDSVAIISGLGKLPLIKTADGGSVFMCRMEFRDTNGANQWAPWIVKLDHSGKIVWQYQYYNPAYFEEPSWMIATVDGGFLVTGNCYSNTTGDIQWMWIMKLDPNGTVEWRKNYTPNQPVSYNFNATAKAVKDGYIILSLMHVMKIDFSGNVLWSRGYQIGTQGLKLSSIQDAPGGGYIAVGSYSMNTGMPDRYDYLVVKISDDGNIEWAKTYGAEGENGEFAYQSVSTRDGNILVAGWSSAYGKFPIWNEVWMLKLKPNGDIIWEKRYGTSYNDYALDLIPAVQHTSNGEGTGYVAAGILGGASGLLICMDENGNVPGTTSSFHIAATKCIEKGWNTTVLDFNNISVIDDPSIQTFDANGDMIDIKMEVKTY